MNPLHTIPSERLLTDQIYLELVRKFPTLAALLEDENIEGFLINIIPTTDFNGRRGVFVAIIDDYYIEERYVTETHPTLNDALTALLREVDAKLLIGQWDI